MEQVIKAKTLGGFVRAISGLFITKDNPSGLSPKECTILSQIIFILNQRKEVIITKEIRQELSNMNNHSMQVSINYINKLKKRGVITQDNKIHEVLRKTRVIIEWNE